MTGRDAEREQLAAALEAGGMPHSIAVRWVPDLLPVVDRIANERAAAALEAAADGPGETNFVPRPRLRDRAAALRASNGQGATT